MNFSDIVTAYCLARALSDSDPTNGTHKHMLQEMSAILLRTPQMQRIPVDTEAVERYTKAKKPEVPKGRPRY